MKHIYFILLLYISGYAQKPCLEIPTVDYGGKTYNTVQIGSQCWLKENLDVGTRINGSGDQTNNGTIEKYCYNDAPANCTTYGGLYQWDEAMQYDTTPGTKGICPSGWQIPTYAELLTLSTAVSNNGNALKTVGQGTGKGSGTNTSGFSALLSGYRYSPYAQLFIGGGAHFWSSTRDDFWLDIHTVYLVSDDSGIYQLYYAPRTALSVRCPKH